MRSCSLILDELVLRLPREGVAFDEVELVVLDGVVSLGMKVPRPSQVPERVVKLGTSVYWLAYGFVQYAKQIAPKLVPVLIKSWNSYN